MELFLNKVLVFILMLLLVMFPFSFNEISDRWNIIFILIMIVAGILIKRKQVKINRLKVIFAILLMIIFGFLEKTDFSNRINVSLDFTSRISLSTIILAFGMIILMVKVFNEGGKMKTIGHSFLKYFLYVFGFILVLMVLFYPFLWVHYDMKLDSNIQLLNKMVKYILIYILAINVMSNERKVKQLSYGFIISIGITVTLSILL